MIIGEIIMTDKDLEEYLFSDVTIETADEYTVLNHFINNHDVVPYKDGYLTILGNQRNFNDKNHIISIHKRNCPIVPMHIFHYVKINYVYAGEICIEFENEEITLKKGDLIIIDKHVPHSIKETSLDDILINIVLKEDFFLEKFINHLPSDAVLSKFIRQMMVKMNVHNHYLLYYTNDNTRIQQCIQNILFEQIEPQLCSNEIIDNYITLLITYLIREYEFETNLRKYAKSDNLFNTIANYIEANFKEGSLSVMSNELGYDAAYLSSFIKNKTGMTFKQWIFEERLKKAAILMLNTSYPVYEISELVGFNNLTSFYNHFKNKYNCTPNDFRNQESTK